MKRLKRKQVVCMVAGGLVTAALTRLIVTKIKCAKADRDLEQAYRWNVATVDLPLDKVRDLIRGMPLEMLGELAETRLRSAPYGPGTEIAVRLRAAGLTDPDADTLQQLSTIRQALRDTTSQLGAGKS